MRQPVAHIVSYYADQMGKWFHYAPMRRILFEERRKYEWMVNGRIGR